MRLNWSQAVDITIDKFTETLPADALDRAKYAEYLTNFLVGKGQITDEKPDGSHYVLNLNAEWGAGKSYFLKRWAEDLKQHYPVVYIDAWQQDYSDDPLLTAISAMINQLRVQAGKPADSPIFQATAKVWGLFKAAFPALAGGLTKRYIGIDPVKLFEENTDQESSSHEFKDEHGQPIPLDKAAQAAVKHLLDEHDSKAKAIKELKQQVKEWVGAVVGLNGQSEHPKNYPAFILVDELDRCRPSYAVEMLETIKHIFDIPGVVFVVATDTEQLQHTVKALYGEGFDARAYLGRFFNSRYTLKTPSLKKLLPVHCDVHKLSQEYLEGKGIISWPDLDYPPEANGQPEKGNLKNLIAVFDAFELNARLALQITERLISVAESLKSNERINLIYLAFMICLNEKYPQYFELMKKYKFADTVNELSPNQNLSTALKRQLAYWDNKSIEISQIDGRKTVDYLLADIPSYLRNFEGSLREFISHIHNFALSTHHGATIGYEEYIDKLRELRRTPNFDSSSSTFGLIVQAFSAQKNICPNMMNKYMDWVELSCSLDSGDAE